MQQLHRTNLFTFFHSDFHCRLCFSPDLPENHIFDPPARGFGFSSLTADREFYPTLKVVIQQKNG